jgi:hypothetical protein
MLTASGSFSTFGADSEGKVQGTGLGYPDRAPWYDLLDSAGDVGAVEGVPARAAKAQELALVACHRRVAGA